MDRGRLKSQEWRERAAYYRALAREAEATIGREAFLQVAEGWDDLAKRVAQLEEREYAAREDGRPLRRRPSGDQAIILARSG